jgi:hypothetical protein
VTLHLYDGDCNTSSKSARHKGKLDLIKNHFFNFLKNNIITNVFVGLPNARDYAKTTPHIAAFNLYKTLNQTALSPIERNPHMRKMWLREVHQIADSHPALKGSAWN